MYYLLAPHLQLTGYLKLPFAIYDLRKRRTEFLNRDQFRLFYSCDGKHDIDMDSLNETDRAFFQHILDGSFATPCEKGETLRPDQEHHYYDNRFKNEVHWSITGKCNYKCKHCFMSAPDAKFGHPTTEQCLNLIAQMEECGIKTVSITGGEPLIRDDLWQIVDALTAHHIAINSILTNGALVSEELLNGLHDRYQYPTFQMSFDGVGWHDWMRGVEGAERKVLDAFRLLHRHHVGASAAMCIHKGNKDAIRESVLKLADVGCSSVKVNRAEPSGEWLKYPEHFLTHEETMQTFMDYIPRYFDDGAPIGLMLAGTFNYEPGADSFGIPCDRMGGDVFRDLPVCASLRNMIYVSPEGNVLPCQSMIQAPIFNQYPNVFTTPLKQILTDSVYLTDVCSNVDAIEKHNAECAHCQHLPHCCGGCRAVAVGANGTDFLAPELDTCHFYKDGWYDRFKALGETEMKRFTENGGLERCRNRLSKSNTAQVDLPQC